MLSVARCQHIAKGYAVSSQTPIVIDQAFENSKYINTRASQIRITSKTVTPHFKRKLNLIFS